VVKTLSQYLDKSVWSKTHVYRQQEIRKNGDESITQIFKDWPPYKNEHGYTLVIANIISVKKFKKICSVYTI